MLSLLVVARLLYPRPQDLEAGPAAGQHSGTPRVFWIYLAGAALVAVGFADFPIIAYHFQHATPSRADADPGLLRRRDGGQRHRLADIRPAVRSARDRGTGPADRDRGRLRAAGIPRRLLGGLVGVCLWGLGMGVHESIIPAAVAPMVSPDRRASAYGLFTGVYGIAWFLGSTAIGALFGVSLAASCSSR